MSPGTPFRVGLRIRLAPGWHTYWQNPGEAGVPPALEIKLPQGAKAGPIAWPTPRRVKEGGLVTYAYTGEVLLPLTVTPAPGNSATPVEVSATWLVCKDICVPEQGTFRLDLPAGHATASAEAPLFARADRALPMPSPWQARVAPDGRLWVSGPELGAATVANAWFIPTESGMIKDAAPQRLSVRDGSFVLALTPDAAFKPDEGLRGILAVVDRTGQETDVALSAVPGPVPAAPALPVARLLGLAFLGGLILNLMPCVFPVLAMKVLALAKGAAHGRMRPHVFSYTLGVLAAFAVLGGTLIGARAAGVAAGWGFQFQSPAFVAAMVWLLFAVGLNLSGVFQIGAGLTGAGGSLAARGGNIGSFFTGLLAVVVAAPCTAPFMAAAIAGGLAAPPVLTMAVFLTLGLGLAAPYVLLAEIPGLVRVLPRPGRWMDRLRQVLAFPMYAAAAWLVWVLSQEAGPAGVLAAVTGLVLVGFAAWVFGATQAAGPRTRRFGQALAAVGLFGLAAMLGGIAGMPPVTPAALASAGSEPFSPARLAALRSAGRPVFVDMTAAWCVTCLVNERLAIDTPAVQQAFADHQVAYLKGDWTRQDPAITNFLRAHGRDGVPLYVYFPPRDGVAVILPQILTQADLLRQLAG